VSETEATARELTDPYRKLPDDSLLELVAEGGLTAQARAALQAEMKRRSLGTKDVDGFERWKEENAPSPPTPTPRRTLLGYGIGYVGKKEPISSGNQHSDSFITTRFIVIRGVTAIPLGSYRAVEGVDGYPKVEERVSLQWDQVWSGMRVFLFASLTGLALAAVSIYFAERKHR
jgi:hypothetical protein